MMSGKSQVLDRVSGLVYSSTINADIRPEERGDDSFLTTHLFINCFKNQTRVFLLAPPSKIT